MLFAVIVLSIAVLILFIWNTVLQSDVDGLNELRVKDREFMNLVASNGRKGRANLQAFVINTKEHVDLLADTLGYKAIVKEATFPQTIFVKKKGGK